MVWFAKASEGCSGNQNNVLVSMRHRHEGPRSCGRGGMIAGDRIAFFSSRAAQNTLNRRNYQSAELGTSHVSRVRGGRKERDYPGTSVL